MAGASVKESARRVVEALPEDATWEDVIYQLYVREAVEGGLQDADAGRVVNVGDVRAEYGLPS
jgi:predicted transcriptional regulator